MVTVCRTQPNTTCTRAHQAHMHAHIGSQAAARLSSSSHLGFSCCAVLVCPAHKDGVVAPAAAVACVAVSAQHAADDVAQVRHVVHVWQGAGDLQCGGSGFNHMRRLWVHARMAVTRSHTCG